MNTDDIKISGTYNLRVEILGKNEDFIHARPIAPNGEYTATGFLEILHKYAPSFAPLPSEIVNRQSSIVNKYDPCRLFKVGDIASPRFVDGRTDIDLTSAHRYTVTKSEDKWGNVRIENDYHSITTKAVFLELITPVEELDPYKLIDSPNTYNIVRDSAMVMTIHKKSHPNAKAAAEAERDRLNAEYRKEQDND